MPDRRSTRAKLTDVLLELPEATRATLVRQIDKARMLGDPEPSYDLILDAAQAAYRIAGQRAPRLISPMRRLFVPIEPFLSDFSSSTKQAGRIARSSLTPIWSWLNRDLLAAELPDLVEQCKQAVLAGDNASADALGAQIVALVDTALIQLPSILTEPDSRRRMAARIGSDRVFHDLVDFARILPFRDEIVELSSRLPGVITAYDPGSLNEHVTALESFVRGQPERMVYGLAVLQSRLSDPSKIVLHACLAAGTANPERLLEGRYAPTVTLALDALEEAVARLRNAVQPGADLGEAAGALRSYHSMARTLLSVLDVGAVPAWRQRLALLRKEASDIAAPLIKAAAPLMRRVIHPTGGRSGEALPFDPIDAQHAACIASLVAAARLCADSLALNALLAETKSSLDPAVENATSALLEAIRKTDGAEREAALARADAAVAITTALFGADYAGLLRRNIATAQGIPRAAAG